MISRLPRTLLCYQRERERGCLWFRNHQYLSYYHEADISFDFSCCWLLLRETRFICIVSVIISALFTLSNEIIPDIFRSCRLCHDDDGELVIQYETAEVIGRRRGCCCTKGRRLRLWRREGREKEKERKVFLSLSLLASPLRTPGSTQCRSRSSITVGTWRCFGLVTASIFFFF